ncbi:MAG: SAM-dependent methyltransferase, partial [Dehalococcoidia bacterium]
MTGPDSDPLAPVVELLNAGPAAGWTRATFSAPDRAEWEKLVVTPVRLKRGTAIKLVAKVGSAETTRTVLAPEWETALEEILVAQPKNVHVATADGEWHARRGKRRWLVSLGRVAGSPGSSLETGPPAHDRKPEHLLDPTDPAVRTLLSEVGMLGRSGQIRGESAAKYRQLQHFLELVRPLAVLEPGRRRSLRIVDAGCGAAHLGLALYLYATRAGLSPTLTGVDRNRLLIEKVAAVAARLRYPSVRFLPADMAAVDHSELGRVDLLVSLHLCDTATDDALLTGVRSKASAIVLAPCCQHELIPQLSPSVLEEPEGTLVRHGATRERIASILTDEFRVLALEAAGYHVQVADFTGPENTAKNLLIRAERRGRGL